MSMLGNDLQHDWDSLQERMNAGDVVGGLMILGRMSAEVMAIVTLMLGAVWAATALSGGLAALGLPFLGSGITALIKGHAPRLINRYMELSRKERAQVRMALRFLHISPATFF